jgi:predicted esterase
MRCGYIHCFKEPLKRNMATTRNLYKKGRLQVRKLQDVNPGLPVPGLQTLVLEGKNHLLYIPQKIDKYPPSFALMLHGAGGNSEHGLSLLKHHADEKNIILLSLSSTDYSWDIIASNSFGVDVKLIEEALAVIFNRYMIDAERIAIGGFSDGASYALSIGLTNGDFFTHVLAFSPGFSYTLQKDGQPHVFISHGVNDHVLPINPCSRRIVTTLKAGGVDVNYNEFNGEHEIPPAISKAAVDWFTQTYNTE